MKKLKIPDYFYGDFIARAAEVGQPHRDGFDPLLAEAHDALGMAYSRDGQWEQSEKSLRRAIALDPSRAMSYDDFVLQLLLVLGRTEEALQQMRVAERIEPLRCPLQPGLRTPGRRPVR